MQPNPVYRLSAQLTFGLLIILLGVLFTLDNLEILEARAFLRFWPLALVVFGLVKVLQPGDTPGRMIGIALVAGGSLMVLDRLDLIEFGWRQFWPLLLIVIGGGLLWNSMQRKQRGEFEPSASDATVNLFALMGGYERKVTTQDFRGGELTAIMGGIEIDLRQASMQPGQEAVLNIFALWGGIEIRVPEDWTVVVQGFPIMGGIEEKTSQPKSHPPKRLLVKGTVIMGGAEIH
jgi:predicted membrane protein